MVLVGYWPLNEDSGSTAYDYSGRGNDGTVSGPTVGVTGVVGTTAYSFNRSDSTDYVKSPYNIDATKSFSVSLWATIDNTDSTVELIWDQRDSNFNGAGLQKDDGSTVTFKGGSTDATGSYTASWSHYVCVYDDSSTTKKLYVNGELKAEVSQDITDSGDTVVIIGNQSGGSSGFDGSSPFGGDIGECRIYNHALSTAEVQYLYTVGKAGTFVSGKKTI